MTAEHRHALPEGFEFEGYRIEGLLGTGGFGLTYRATEIELGRLVAIKEYLPNGIAGREAGEAAVHAISAAAQEEFDWGLDRYRGEAKTLVAFRHPNIVNVLRFFQAHGTAYLVMEFVEGETLEAIIARDGLVPEDKLRALLGPLLDGLENIHEAGFLHRDIKPGNIFVRADGTPVLIDFGSARASLGAASKGMTAIVSGGYAPVEQYTTHGKQGPWSDLYGLGSHALPRGRRPATARGHRAHRQRQLQARCGRRQARLFRNPAGRDRRLPRAQARRPAAIGGPLPGGAGRPRAAGSESRSGEWRTKARGR